jgi:diguanylate cyclase
MAYYDSLTGLPNRHLFREQLNNAVEICHRNHQNLALMFLDLDNFKRINDTYGHGTGDALLKAVAARLNSTLRNSHRDEYGDTNAQEVIIGKFGGDEFNVMMMGISPQAAGIVAKRILTAFSSPFALDGQDITTGISIGISLCPSDGKNADTLLKNADAAMYHAKENGRSNFKFFSQSMNELSLKKMALENDLHKALTKEEFYVYYQPKINCVTEAVIGAEALIRWNHPSKGLVLPGEFIQVAEETGLIIPIGKWVLKTVCSQIKTWQQSGISPVPVAVNLSTVQIRQNDLVQNISEILSETGIDPSYLQLEITESMIMHNEDEADVFLHELRTLGCKISIDDFGTGYSSLSRLKRFSLDALKVDRSFIKDLATSRDDQAITRAIIAMAHSLELRVIAEGVETQEQCHFLKSLDCDEIQGFLFGHPMAKDDFAMILMQQQPNIRIDVPLVDLADW